MIPEPEQTPVKPRRNVWQWVRPYLIVLVAGYAIWAVAMHFAAWHMARSMTDGSPSLLETPTPIKDQHIADLSGIRVQEFGFSFQVPWSKLRYDRVSGSEAVLFFTDGGGLLLESPQSQIKPRDIYRSMGGRDLVSMTRLLGTKPMSSNYEFLAAEVQATPNDVKWWTPRRGDARATILLLQKDMELDKCKVIHPVVFGVVRGFQFCDPDVAPYRVNLELFDGQDHEYSVRILSNAEHGPAITQVQINALIASLVPQPAQ